MKQRKLLKTSIGFCLLLCVTALAMPASATATQNDPSVELFWSKFKTAVQKSDKNAVAAMSQFPVGMPYGYPEIKTRAQLVRRWRVLFNVQANAVKCFEEAKPVVDPATPKRFTVGCKNEAGDEVVIYGFQRGRAGWKLIYLDNINE